MARYAGERSRRALLHRRCACLRQVCRLGRTVPFALRNPLCHWTHLELKRYFGIDGLLNEQSAKAIWERANSLLATNGLTTRGILKQFRVRVVCTTDDPSEDLAHHKAVNSSAQDLRIFPTFRPDKALQVDAPGKFNAWL